MDNDATVKPQPHTCIDNSTYFTALLASKTNDSLRAKERLEKKVQQLQHVIRQCDQAEALNTAYKHVNAAVTLLSAIEKQSTTINLVRKRNISPNSNIEQQRYYSTKKKRTGTIDTISKPTQEELEDTNEKLLKEEPLFCAICFKKQDTSNSPTIRWVQCSVCDIWIHQQCTSIAIDEADVNVDYVYVCQYCNK